MHVNGMTTLQQRENFITANTPQGYHTHHQSLDNDNNLRNNITNPHRRGNSNNMDMGRSPQK